VALAFFASAWATLDGAGALNFESIAMFVVLLLASRYGELRTRIKARAQFDDLARIIPQTAVRMDAAGGLETLAVTAFEVGDTVLVKAGEIIPFDGLVAAGTSAVDEAVLSGESTPQAKRRDSTVLGGSINIESPLEILITRRVGDAFIAEISRLAQNAQTRKPRLLLLANRIAGHFIIGVLLIAAVSAVYWWTIDPARVLPVSIAVLVITCPCALALATPSALVAASGALLRNGIVAFNTEAIETLARANTFIFDKTGTLTSGELQLVNAVDVARRGDPSAIAAALSAHSAHSIARAMQGLAGHTDAPATDLTNFPGRGIAGTVAGERYWFGSARFVAEETGIIVADDLLARLGRSEKTAFLGNAAGVIAAWQFRDAIKPGARALIAALRTGGATVAMLTGDTAGVAGAVAQELGIEDVHAACQPHEKLAELERRQRAGDVCVVIGDGVNDAPMLAHGFVGVAVGNACDLTKSQADLILLRDDLGLLLQALRISRQTLRVIRQNISWAIAYNVCALPLAIAGVVPPWLAALGMSASSLLVVANAARINRAR
jgi:Cu2+-exporting ATPase